MSVNWNQEDDGWQELEMKVEHRTPTLEITPEVWERTQEGRRSIEAEYGVKIAAVNAQVEVRNEEAAPVGGKVKGRLEVEARKKIIF